ncbi:MAG TPA: thymidine kinase [Longimicrobiaceae bacterium]|nr:thymidine kinase [Longimicrobiaceae bacterium]
MRDTALYHSDGHGWIEVITGSMFSGKSEELIRRVRRALIAKRRVQVFKSALDDRYEGLRTINSHDGSGVEAIPVRSSTEMLEKVHRDTQVIAIDEVQFLDDGVVDVISLLADRGMRVIVAGIDMDFRGEPFGPMARILAVAETVDKLHAICVRCGSPATRNQRLVNGEPAPYEAPTIQVGGAESYEARCRHCHEVPSVTRDQTSLLGLLYADPADTVVLTHDNLRPRRTA